MQLVERHLIRKGDARFDEIDRAAFAAKNLYNVANYQVRQAFINEGIYLNYVTINQQLKSSEQYQALPRKVSQQVLRLLEKNWKSFFALRDAWCASPERFRGRPGLPQYLQKQTGRHVLVYTIQTLSRVALRRGVIQPSGLTIAIKTQQSQVAQMRIVPKDNYYVVEVIYERKIEPAVLNQWYNKRIAQLQQKLGKPGRTALMRRMTNGVSRLTTTCTRTAAGSSTYWCGRGLAH